MTVIAAVRSYRQSRRANELTQTQFARDFQQRRLVSFIDDVQAYSAAVRALGTCGSSERRTAHLDEYRASFERARTTTHRLSYFSPDVASSLSKQLRDLASKVPEDLEALELSKDLSQASRAAIEAVNEDLTSLLKYAVRQLRKLG
ncbi:MAG: hypothetical protein H6702_18820 [Myxococcales bacterium]|nr:hypothetical protein [Myxococcales bacterium]